jgi:uncharacterized integral membrane protein (TIGR00698 family)
MAGAAAVVALAVSGFLPLLGPLLVALALGVLAANVPGVQRFVVGTSPRLDKLLLRSGVVLLGLKVSLADVADLGMAGVGVVLLTVVVTFATTQLVGRALGLSREMTTLIAAGFAICGAAAIAAIESTIRARAKDVALAVALVTVLGSAMIGVVPLLSRTIGLTDEQAAVWAGASIHEVAQVIAAGSLVSSAAVATATTVKLARVALLAPVQVVSARVCRKQGIRQGPLVPAFLVGFVAAVAVRSSGLLPHALLERASELTTLLLSAAMFGLGTTIVARQLWPVPIRVLALACISTGVAALVSIAMVTSLV